MNLSPLRENEILNQNKIAYYEALIEDLMAQNTKLNLNYKSQDDITAERDFLIATLE